MEKYSISEILEQAVQTEKLGHDFYIDMANRFDKDDKLRQLMETLAVKEQEHERKFAGLREKIADAEISCPEEVSRYLRAIVESEFFLGREKSLPSLEHIKNIEDAVRYAIDFEKETLLYYHSLRDLVPEREVVDELINEEKTHIVWLSDFKKAI